MLNDTTHDRISQRVADQRPPVASGKALGLTCRTCGRPVELAFWQPLACCPHCGTLAYPDRALRNLLPLGWECAECGAANDGLTNFCLECGSGLVSRCPRCEAAVYGAVCLSCGEHQAHLRRLQKGQAGRAGWLPVQRARIQEQRSRLEELRAETGPASAPAPVVTGAPPRSAQTGRDPTRRPRRRGGMWRFGWGWMFLAWGLYSMLQRGGFAQALPSTVQTTGSNLTQGLGSAWSGLQGWWAAFIPSLNQAPTLTPSDPQYAYLFAIVLIGLIALPFGLFLIDRVIKRLFP
jgi:hypothetical protein